MCVCVCVRAGRSVCLECIWACTCAHPVCGEWGRDGLTDRVKRESALSQTRDFSMTCSPWHALYLRRLSELYSSVSINFSRVNASLQRGNGKTLKQPLSLSLFLSFFLFFFVVSSVPAHLQKRSTSTWLMTHVRDDLTKATRSGATNHVAFENSRHVSARVVKKKQTQKTKNNYCCWGKKKKKKKKRHGRQAKLNATPLTVEVGAKR